MKFNQFQLASKPSLDTSTCTRVNNFSGVAFTFPRLGRNFEIIGPIFGQIFKLVRHSRSLNVVNIVRVSFVNIRPNIFDVVYLVISDSAIRLVRS